MNALRLIALCCGVAAIYTCWSVSSPAVELALGPVPMGDGPFEGLESFFGLVWLGLRLFFWLLVGLVGTAVILFALASVGVLTWVVQQLCKGFAFVGGQFKEMLTPKPESLETPIATIPSGQVVSVRDVLENHEGRIAALEAKSESV